jgi:hypothetical protein
MVEVNGSIRPTGLRNKEQVKLCSYPDELNHFAWKVHSGIFPTRAAAESEAAY